MRAIWSGAISFGLIYIPVRLYNASKSQQIEFDLLRRSDHCRVRYKRVCESDGEEVPYEQIVKGYAIGNDQYVVLEKEDFQRANVQKMRTIDIVSFINAAEVDHKYLKRPYYLVPDPGAQKVYTLLRAALKKSARVALASFVLRSRESLAILTAEDNAIILNTVRFFDELIEPVGLNLPHQEKVTSKELDLAVKLVDQLTEPWQPELYRDTYTEDLKRMITEKIEGSEASEVVEEEPLPTDPTEIFAQLNQSIAEAKDRRSRR